MAYIGKQPLVGNYTVLDPLTATTTDTYTLTKVLLQYILILQLTALYR